ncbi:MAG: hypothetical protein RL684_2515 [Pseudomonadota bacterium]|jgi:TetR/AcrR family transcriptional repressor of nem operon
MAKTPKGTTPERILDAAERLVQTRGFNGISYADIAGEVGVTKANLHHHFGSKAQLGEALLKRYMLAFSSALAQIDAAAGPVPARLDAYAGLYAGVVRNRRLCLCGVLAAEFETLGEPMRAGVKRFFDGNEAWLTRTLRAGRAEGTILPRFDETEAARLLIASLEGAMLVTRPRHDHKRFEALARTLFTGLGIPLAPARAAGAYSRSRAR